MKKRILLIVLMIILTISFVGCADGLKAKHNIKTLESKIPIDLPDNFKCLFRKTIVAQDSEQWYLVLTVDKDYKLDYDKQFYTEYASYETVNVFDKIALAKWYFKNIINEKDEQYFVSQLDNYDWYAYEYEIKRTYDDKERVIRYADLYLIHDKDDNELYIFYDVHQYPYNEQY